jgi:LytS/YehU family sensor histidine kinase
MNKILTTSEYLPFPKVLTYIDIRSYALTAVFVLLAVFTPWVFHQFHLAGPTFLPMHIFVLAAGLLFGWRAGLVVGLFTPLASYAISGMPVLAILPQIVVELSVYGLVAGILRERFNLRVIWSLIGAVIAGRLALLLVVSIIYLGREVYSPLGVGANPLAVLWSVIKLGWPGIVIQLVSIPLIMKLLERLALRNRRG